MKLGKKTLSVILSVAMVSTLAVSSAAVASAADKTAAKTASSFSWDNASVYFLLTDRFNNGDTSNDHSYNRGLNQDGTVANLNTNAAAFQGGDFVGITQKINEGYFNDLGVNALWISAPYEQTHGYIVGGTGKVNYPHYAYHGYYVLDYTNPDANFGTLDEFRQMVDTAHEHGIRVVLDVVMNHAGYATMVDMDQYGFGVMDDNWKDTYYDWNNISNKAFDKVINYKTQPEKWAKWWGSDWLRAGIAGYTDGGSDDLTKCLEYLPDFKTESTKEVGIPEILKTKWTQEGTLSEKEAYIDYWFAKTGYPRTTRYYEICWLSAWVSEFGIDGFRCDTAKHVEKESWSALKTECTKALAEWKAENPDKALDDSSFWMTGENYGMGLEPSSDYYTDGGFDSMINFTQGGGVPELTKIASTYQDYADKINTNDNFNVLTYISSHDDTLANKKDSDMYYQGTAFQLLPGAIQIFYGDESNRQRLSAIHLDNGSKISVSSLGDHSLRSFMNWDSIDNDLEAHWQKVGKFRSSHVAVGAGANAAISSSDANGVAFTRVYDKNGVKDSVAAVITSAANTDVSTDVSSIFADGSVVRNAYDGTTATVANGSVTFNSGAHNTILIEAVSAEAPTTPSTPATEPTVPVDDDTNPTTPADDNTNPATEPATAASTDATVAANVVNDNDSSASNSSVDSSSNNDASTGKVATGDSAAVALLTTILLAAGGVIVAVRKKYDKA